MNIRTRPEFDADVAQQSEWYLLESNLDPDQAIELVDRFNAAVDASAALLARDPRLGKRRLKDFSDLAEMRSHPVQKPFQRFRLFYQVDETADVLILHRLIAAESQAASGRD